MSWYKNKNKNYKERRKNLKTTLGNGRSKEKTTTRKNTLKAAFKLLATRNKRVNIIMKIDFKRGRERK